MSTTYETHPGIGTARASARLTSPLTGSLRVAIVSGASVTEETMRELFAFRQRMMPHCPGADIDADWSRLRSVVRDATWVLTGHDSDSVLRTSVVLDAVVETDHVFLETSYGYVDPLWRGRWEILAAWCRLIMRFLRLMPGRRLFFGGLAYATSALGADRLFSPVWMMGDAEPHEPVVARRLAWIHARRGGTPGGSPWIQLSTRPQPQPSWWYSFAARSPAYQRYVAINPDWHLGRALPVVAEIRWHHLTPLLARAMRRAARNLVRR